MGPLLLTGAAISYACGSSPPPNLSPGGDAGSGGATGADAGSSSGAPSSSTSSSGGPRPGSSSGSGSGGSSSGVASSSSSSGGSSNGSSGVGSSGTGSGSGSSTGSSGAPAGDGGTTAAAPVLQHHTNPSRDGVYTSPALTKTAAAAIKLDATFAPTVSGNVYAQPLYVPNGPGGAEAFIVATESNHVTAIGGTGTTLWDHTYGTPATTANLPCGNISPLGVTGTPIIDMPSRTLFFDAMTNTNGTLDHMIHAVSIDDGTEKTGWPVDVNQAVTGFDSSHQNQRGALALVGGVLYVPYGGHLGDCGAYHGWVVAVSITSPSTVTSWTNNGIDMTTAFKGGIWAAGGVASDGTNVYVSTGNTSTSGATNTGNVFMAPSSWAGGEAVFRLTSGAKFSNQPADYYFPATWAAMDNRDEDLGGANPMVVDVGSTHYIVALGKDGNLYLLNRDNLGGMAGEISITQVSTNGGAIIGAPVAYTTASGTYVAFRGPTSGCPAGQTGGNLEAVRIAPGAPKVVWCSTQNLGSPMVTTTGNGDAIVWDANTRLYGYDGDTGTAVFNGGAASDAMANAMQYMDTPIGAGSRIVVATPNHLYAFHP